MFVALCLVINTVLKKALFMLNTSIDYLNTEEHQSKVSHSISTPV